MIDKNAFNEMMDRGFITNVGLDSEKFKDIDELIDYGYATNVASDEVYAALTNEPVEVVVDEDESTITNN